MLAPVVRGGAAGVRALLKRAHGHGVRGSLAKAAERFLRRHVELEDASPFHDAPAARAEHAARMSEAQVAAAGAGFRGDYGQVKKGGSVGGEVTPEMIASLVDQGDVDEAISSDLDRVGEAIFVVARRKLKLQTDAHPPEIDFRSSTNSGHSSDLD
jgi:hypothetical protein